MDNKRIISDIIDIILDQNIDWRTMGVKLAKINPELLIELVKTIPPTRFPDLPQILKNHGKIQAIKYIRHESGMGLKEAKEFVDEYCLVNSI